MPCIVIGYLAIDLFMLLYMKYYMISYKTPPELNSNVSLEWATH
jgi:hypothetical protein